MTEELVSNENIYHVDKKLDVQQQKPALYKSKFQDQIQMEYKAVKDYHRTMGYAEVPLRPPNEFLKKDQGIHVQKPQIKHVHVTLKPPVPKRGESSAAPKSDPTKRIASAIPKKVVPRYVDKRSGDTFDVKKAGMLPSFVKSSTFGKMPKYLVKRAEEAKEQQQAIQDAEDQKKPLCRYVTQEERAELLRGLKENWAELQRGYQALPILTDTIPKKNRKTKIENDLKALEKDIIFLESNPNIYIYDEDQVQQTQS